LEHDSILELKGITKAFDHTTVLNGIDLTVSGGEFITILGSSGCGKTTLLRIIAGLEEADSGTVTLEGQDVTALEPNRRNVNTVFQNYALFPHMTVGENVAYALKLRREPKKVIRKKVSDALALVRLEGMENRMPEALSGGQKQRVAIARAIIAEPKILLLDEPLGALDLNLRRQMQLELKKLQKQVGITFIYITHDQEEALTMSDRIAVMNSGRFLQIGSPSEIYDSPADIYTARFVGEANVLPVTVSEISGDTVSADCFGTPAAVRTNGLRPAPGTAAYIAIRGERIGIEKEAKNGIPCVVAEKQFTGGLMKLTLVPAASDRRSITVSRYGFTADFEEGDRVSAVLPPMAAVLLRDTDRAEGV